MKSILTSLFSLVLCASLQAQLPSYVPADGLVGWWPFNGNANDESGNGNDGVVNGSTLTEDRFGNAESAYAFDGLGNYIRVLNNPNINVTGSNISLLYWIRYQNINDGQIKGLSKGGYDIGSGYELVLDFRPSSGGPNLAFNGGGGTPAGCNFSSFQNSWTCVVAVMNNGIASIYINGVQQSIWSSGSVSSFNSNSNDLYFGTRTPGNNYQGFLQGELDDIAIYNRALTPSEITQLYTAAEEPVETCAPLAPNLQNGLVGYWPFCGNANDESGNGNNGVVNGATLAEDRFGNANAAYAFDGENSIISTELSEVISTQWTISLWFTKDNLETFINENLIGIGLDDNSFGSPAIALNGQGPSQCFILTSNTEIIYIFDGSNECDNTSLGNNFSRNQWYNLSLIKQDSSVYLFENGVLSLETSSLNFTDFSHLFFGSRHLFNSQFFNGKLDDIAIWNRALTPEEITQLYTGVAPCNLIASETQDTPVEVGGSAQLYVTLNASDYSMQWQTNAAGLGWMDVQDNNTYTGSQTQNLLVSNVSLANHEQPFRIIVTDGICNDTSDVALLLVNNTCTAYDTITTTIEVFDTLTIENVVEVFDTLTTYNTIDIFDTTTVTVEVFDTITNVIDVFDTTTIYLQVDIFDTLFIDVYDTTYVQQTIDVYDTTYVTLTDTTYIQVIDTAYVTVTDTLLIDITFVGFEGQPSWLNTVLVYPNPTSDHITIDYGNFALMAGYNTVITDAAGATVYSSAVNTQQAYIDINAWGAAGVYYMSIYDVNGAVVAVRQIVLE